MTKFASILWLSILFSSVSIAGSFAQIYALPAEGFVELADRVVAARADHFVTDYAQKMKSLLDLQAELELLTDERLRDPMLWFVYGLNQNSLAEARYMLVLEREGRSAADRDREVTDYNVGRSQAYERAIFYDDRKPHRLSAEIYATMGYGLTNRLKAETYTRELSLGNASENESSEIFMHWAKIDVLVKERRLSDAQQALEELKQLLESKGRNEGNFEKVVERAQASVGEAATPSKRPTTGSQNTGSTEQNRPTQSRASSIPSSINKPWVLALFGVLIVSAVGAICLHFASVFVKAIS